MTARRSRRCKSRFRICRSVAPPAPDTQAVDALRQRLSKIEHDIANLPPGDATVADRLTAADSAMKSLGIALAALNKRNDDAAANAKQAEERAAAAEKAVSELRDSVQSAKQQASAAVDAGQLAAVQQRVAALEQSMKDARAQIAANATTDQAARLALSAAALRDAVERGAPYQSRTRAGQSARRRRCRAWRRSRPWPQAACRASRRWRASSTI